MHSKTLIGALALILMIPAVASAALFSASFANLYDTDEIVLAITPDQESRNITFESVDFPGQFNQTPAPVPLPTSGWMLLSGLALFIGIRRHSSG